MIKEKKKLRAIHSEIPIKGKNEMSSFRLRDIEISGNLKILSRN